MHKIFIYLQIYKIEKCFYFIEVNFLFTGQRFAMLELKTLVAHLLHNFILEPIDHSRDIKFSVDLVIRPATSIRVKFTPRVK